MTEEILATPEKKVYKLRMLVSILYLLLSPLSLIFFLGALLSYDTADTPPGFLDSVIFGTALVLPFVMIISSIGGMWCARGAQGKKKNIVGCVFLFLPLLALAIISLMHV